MKLKLAILAIISIFESAHFLSDLECVCLQNNDYVNCGAYNFKKNVVRAKIDNSQRLMTNSIPFDHVTHLKIQCKITTVELDSFQNQRSLKFLDLSNNQLNDLPTNIFTSIPFLEKLNISRNKFKSPSLDTFGKLTGLKELDASHNTIGSIKIGVLDVMTKLEQLHLNNNKISKLQHGLFDMLVNLRKIDLSNNQLNEIELNVFMLTKSLEDVKLSGNDLSGDESLIGLNSLTSVVNLDLSNCKISNLPASIFTKLTKLKKLNLSFNSITVLPKTFDLARDFTTLHMSHNRILFVHPHTFDYNLKLEEIDWSYNQLNTLPEGLFNFTENFKYLNISHNAINQLPLKIFQWSSLTEIDLSFNDFTTIEPELLNMETLERIHAQHNKISYLEDMAFSSCTFPVLYINLQYNRLVYLQEYFFDWLTNLEKLEIFGNPWDCACLQDLIKLLTDRFIEYDIENYETTKAICVAGEKLECQYYTTNLTYYYEMYKNIL